MSRAARGHRRQQSCRSDSVKLHQVRERSITVLGCRRVLTGTDRFGWVRPSARNVVALRDLRTKAVESGGSHRPEDRGPRGGVTHTSSHVLQCPESHRPRRHSNERRVGPFKCWGLALGGRKIQIQVRFELCRTGDWSTPGHDPDPTARTPPTWPERPCGSPPARGLGVGSPESVASSRTCRRRPDPGAGGGCDAYRPVRFGLTVLSADHRKYPRLGPSAGTACCLSEVKIFGHPHEGGRRLDRSMLVPRP